MNYRMLYFASLCDAAGRAEETIASDAGDVRALYAELAARHGFTFTPDRLRVAVNGAYTDRSEEHTSELQSHVKLVCRRLLEKKKKGNSTQRIRGNVC